jgi:hypothetical protein
MALKMGKYYSNWRNKMIGLLFLFVLVVWATIALALGSKIPQWLGIIRHRVGLGFLFALLVFVAPVADEIIAYPQMRALCASVGDFKFDPHTATGQTVSKYPPIISKEMKTLFPNIQILVQRGALVTPYTEIPIVTWGWIEPQAGFLKFPAGSSGGSMPLLLADCGSTPRPRKNMGSQKHGVRSCLLPPAKTWGSKTWGQVLPLTKTWGQVLPLAP